VKVLKEQGHPVNVICEVLGISRSKYYRKKGKTRSCNERSKTKKSDEEKIVGIMKKIKEKRPYFGYRRMFAWLRRKEKIFINKKKVYRLMKENELLCKVKRHKVKRSSSGRTKPKPSRKNEWWGIDMTKFLVSNLGWVYLVVVLDWWTKKIIGWNVSVRCRSKEWIKALDDAVDESCPAGSREYGIHLMSDNGCQPTSVAFMNECEELGIEQAFTSYDNPKGNADTERVIRTLKEECIWLNEWETLEEVQEGIAKGIADYNANHIHSALNYLTPNEFDEKYENEVAVVYERKSREYSPFSANFVS